MRTASRKSLSAAWVAMALLCMRKPRLPAISINWVNVAYMAGPQFIFPPVALVGQPCAVAFWLGFLLNSNTWTLMVGLGMAAAMTSWAR